MDQDEMLDEAERTWRTAAAVITGDDYSRASRNPDWTNLDLLNHVVGGAIRYRMLLEGSDAASTNRTREVDHLGADREAAFDRTEGEFRDAVRRVDLEAIVDHRAGPRTGHELVVMRALELVLHARDLGPMEPVVWDVSPRLAEHLLTAGTPIITQLRASGLYGPPVEPASNLAVHRLQGIAGRR